MSAGFYSFQGREVACQSGLLLMFRVFRVWTVGFALLLGGQEVIVATHKEKAPKRAAERPGVCETHKEQMAKVKVPIHYGLPDGDVAMNSEIQERKFPNAPMKVLGGCEPALDAPTKATVYHCPKCLAARDAWLAVKKRTIGSE
jgi:hypothetical protein